MTLIKMTAADMAGSISNRGHSYAMSHSCSRVNAASNLSEILGGMTQVFMGIIHDRLRSVSGLKSASTNIIILYHSTI